MLERKLVNTSKVVIGTYLKDGTYIAVPARGEVFIKSLSAIKSKNPYVKAYRRMI